MNQTKKTNWGELPVHYINSLRDIRAHEEIFKYLYQQEYPVSTFISRLTDALQGKDNANHGHRKDDYVRVRVQDLDEILRQFVSMDIRLREIHTDLDLRSDPEIINIPNGLEKELNIKRIINFRSKLK